MDVCTVIAKNYLAHARVLAESFRAHHPDGTCWVLIVDQVEGYVRGADEPFELVTPADLDIDDFDRMAALYSVLELSTAVKPWFLRHLLGERGLQSVVYLDPDIRVYDSLEEIAELLTEHKLVINPHLTAPMPRDGKRPSETDILIAGSYNLGFGGFAAGPETDELLDWWAERLRTDCVVAPERGHFVDQRWMDFAPGLVKSFYVLRDEGYNVAYWNLPSRKVRKADGRFLVNGRPLRFFHFSGFDADKPNVLSKHQDRIRLADEPALAELCRAYADELVERGWEDVRGWPYTYGTLADGTPLDEFSREMYRQAESRGEIAAPIFTPAGSRELVDWLRAPAPEGGHAGVNRYLWGLHEKREDLKAAFPDLAGEDAQRFMAWATVFGRGEVPIPSVFLPDDGGAPTAASNGQAADLQLGVNVIGYLSAALGVGESGRQLAAALEAQGVPVSAVELEAEFSPREQGGVVGSSQGPRYPVNLAVVNADVLPDLATDRPDLFAERYSIGYWAWETSRLPERWLDAFQYVDEVWVGSHFVADALTTSAPVPVVKITLPVAVPRIEPFDRSALGLPEGFLFLFAFDYNSVFERKNPLALVEAFKRAFPNDSEAWLVLKCINHERDPANHDRVLQAVGDRSDITIVDRHVPRAEKDAMMAACDCYVSLHRSEGFGITLAEAMALGKPAVATAYSGNLEFMTPRNSYLVDFELTRVGEGADPYPADDEWAEPDIGHAAELMREVFDHPEEARRRGQRAREDIERKHSPRAAGRAMAERLGRIGAGSARRTPGREGLGAVDASRVAERLRRGPAGPPQGPSRLAPARQAARRSVLRVMKPYTAHQSQVDGEFLKAIRALDDSLRGLTMTHATALARLQHHEERIDAQAARIEAESARLEARDRRIEELAERVGSAARLADESRTTPFMAEAPFARREHPVAGAVVGYEGLGDDAIDGARGYRRFEDIFRGSESFIRDRQRRYLDLIGDAGPVVDVGCGRGEFLDVLAERGLEYVGVDADPGMVDRCRAKGHEGTRLGQGNDYLEEQADDSLGTVFSSQVIEHLPYEELLRFLELARRKLRPGGTLIAETVNPHSARALKAFWVDPTHRHPVFPEVALALCMTTGFASAFVFHPNGTDDVEADRFEAGEYAVIASTGASRREEPAGEAAEASALAP